jgi:hypothetical protein
MRLSLARYSWTLLERGLRGKSADFADKSPKGASWVYPRNPLFPRNPRSMSLISPTRVDAYLRRILIAAFLLPACLAAQATPTVSLDDRVYRDLDRLFGDGLVKKMLMGQRPYSRREIARIVREASANAATMQANAADQRRIARLSAEFGPEISMLAGDTVAASALSHRAARFEILGTNSLARPIPPDSLGTVEADINPLLSDRMGRTYRPGVNASAEGEVSGSLARPLAFRARGRALLNGNAGGGLALGELLLGSATVMARDIDLEVGRQQLATGQAMGGGLLFSSSGRALDMIRLANDTPLYAPSFLRILGPLRGTLLYADLGPNQRFPHSNVIAYKASGNPFTWRFELAATVLGEQGGRGGPQASVGDYIIDLIPILKYAVSNKNRSQFSNKFAGVDYSLRVPELGGMRIYFEHTLDDADPRRWGSTFWSDAGHIGGISFANLGGDGALGATAEFHHTGLRFYEHTPYTSGLAFNRVLLGDPLGNEADAAYLRLSWDAASTSSFTVDGAIERRYGNVLGTTTTGPREDNFRFVTLVGFPPEWRHRVAATWSYEPSERWRAQVQGGYERVRDYAFVRGSTRNQVLASASIELRQW